MKNGSCSCPVTWVAKILLIVGGLNWGLVGAFDYNLVTTLVGTWPAVEAGVYILVGLAAIWMIIKMLMGCSKK